MNRALGLIGAVTLAVASSTTIAADESEYKLVAAKILVKDSQKTIDFYNRLGMKAGQKHNAMEQQLDWEKPNTGASIVIVRDETGRFKMVPGGSFLVFMVPDVKAIAKKLKEVGAEVGEPIGDGKTYAILLTRDPDGNRIELVQALAPMPK